MVANIVVAHHSSRSKGLAIQEIIPVCYYIIVDAVQSSTALNHRLLNYSTAKQSDNMNE